MMKLVDWKEASQNLLDEKIGIIPTDTVYGLVGLAKSKRVVERIYKVKKRDKKKPFVILISTLNDLRLFGVDLNFLQKRFLKKIWPGSTSVVLPCSKNDLEYLHRKKYSLAFRMPKDDKLLKLLKKTGPLVAPSANIQGEKIARSSEEAYEYFKEKLDFYCGKRSLTSKPSTLMDLTGQKVRILRKGQKYLSCLFWSKIGII